MFVYTRMHTHMHTCMHIPGVSSGVQSFIIIVYDYAINSVFFSLRVYVHIYSTCIHTRKCIFLHEIADICMYTCNCMCTCVYDHTSARVCT